MFYAYKRDGTFIAESQNVAELSRQIKEPFSVIVDDDCFVIQWSTGTPITKNQRKITADFVRSIHTTRMSKKPDETDDLPYQQLTSSDSSEDTEDDAENTSEEAEETEEASEDISEEDTSEEDTEEDTTEQPKRRAKKKRKCAAVGCRLAPAPVAASTRPELALYCMRHRRSVATKIAMETKHSRRHSLTEISQILVIADELGGLDRIRKIAKVDRSVLNALIKKVG